MRTLPALALAGLCLLLAPRALADGDPARGKQLLFERGCAACHSFDGSARPGPTYLGLVGKTRKVVTQEKTREIVADEAYIRRSILEPNHDIVEGYMPGAMPGLAMREGDVDHLVAAIAEIGGAAKAAPPKTEKNGSLGLLAAATLSFVLGHIGLSSVTLRRPLIQKLSEKGFQGVYSILVLAAFIWMIFAYRAAPHVELWQAPAWTRWIPLVVMPIAFFFLVCGYSTQNPTQMMQEKAVGAEPRGIVRITRHPALWSFALWAMAHIPPNGDVASVCLFGGIACLAIAGMLHIDSRRKLALGDAWEPFAAKTSLVPFARGGVGKALGEIGIVRFVVAILLYVGMLHGHRMVIGVSAMP
ncbi:NnrU family protein [Polyangium sp. y55x31]|uniref:NnrU family protein n=1 Tax=Polyangium sp. y55x31 TaxID=3042688 RepID=UPI002482516C|nr:NnrU family protein [Polyangium sp. y55x31]MDI1478677.1 NnrU family protein [Polyangium sp. y55x31]